MFVMMGMGLGQIGALLGAGGGISAPPPITAIAADGWRATYPTPPSLTPLSAPVTVTVSRQGFTPGGLATSVADTLTLMARLAPRFVSLIVRGRLFVRALVSLLASIPLRF